MKTKVWKTAQALEIHFTAGDSFASLGMTKKYTSRTRVPSARTRVQTKKRFQTGAGTHFDKPYMSTQRVQMKTACIGRDHFVQIL